MPINNKLVERSKALAASVQGDIRPVEFPGKSIRSFSFQLMYEKVKTMRMAMKVLLTKRLLTIVVWWRARHAGQKKRYIVFFVPISRYYSPNSCNRFSIAPCVETGVICCNVPFVQGMSVCQGKEDSQDACLRDLWMPRAILCVPHAYPRKRYLCRWAFLCLWWWSFTHLFLVLDRRLYRPDVLQKGLPNHCIRHDTWKACKRQSLELYVYTPEIGVWWCLAECK